MEFSLLKYYSHSTQKLIPCKISDSNGLLDNFNKTFRTEELAFNYSIVYVKNDFHCVIPYKMDGFPKIVEENFLENDY